MKKVVHLTTVHNVFDNRIFYKECIGIIRKGYQAVLVAPYDRDELIEQVQIRALPRPGNRLVRFFCTSLQAYKKVLFERNVDVIHFHDPELLLLGILLKVIHKRPVVYDIHEDYVTAIKQKKYIPSFLRPVVASFFGLLEIWFANYFSIVIAEKYYSYRFPNGVKVLNYPWKNQFSNINLPRKQPERPKLLYTGSVTEDRGAYIHAALTNSYEGATVSFIGKCSRPVADKIYKVAFCNSSIRILGIEQHITFKTIMDFYKNESWTAGLALFPPTPHYLNKELTKLFEYMAAGIPVICSDFPVWQRLIGETGAGICVNPYEEVQVVSAIDFLFKHPAEAVEMGKQGRKAIIESYNWENELVKLDRLYSYLLACKS